MLKPLLVWQIIWVNLSFNSAIVNWYVTNVKSEVRYSKQELLELLMEEYPTLKDATLKNPIDALVNMFCNSPLGTTEVYDDSSVCVGVMEKKGVQVKSVCKQGTSNISSVAVAYLLYKNAEENNIYEFTVTNIYEKGFIGVSNVFNMKSEDFLNALRGLMTNEILSADLLGGLDNIHLVNEFTSYAVLNKMIKGYGV